MFAVMRRGPGPSGVGVNRRDLEMKAQHSGDGDAAAAVRLLPGNPPVISMSAISRKRAKQKHRNHLCFNRLGEVPRVFAKQSDCTEDLNI